MQMKLTSKLTFMKMALTLFLTVLLTAAQA